MAKKYKKLRIFFPPGSACVGQLLAAQLGRSQRRLQQLAAAAGCWQLAVATTRSTMATSDIRPSLAATPFLAWSLSSCTRIFGGA